MIDLEKPYSFGKRNRICSIMNFPHRQTIKERNFRKIPSGYSTKKKKKIEKPVNTVQYGQIIHNYKWQQKKTTKNVK